MNEASEPSTLPTVYYVQTWSLQANMAAISVFTVRYGWRWPLHPNRKWLNLWNATELKQTYRCDVTYTLHCSIKILFQNCFPIWCTHKYILCGLPGGGDIFSAPFYTVTWTHPASCIVGTGSLSPGIRRPGCCVKCPTPPIAEVKERVDLYLCSPSVPSWPNPQRTLFFALPF